METTNTANTAIATTRTATRRVIFTCKCGSKAHDYTATRRYNGTDRFGAMKWSTPVLTRDVDGRPRDISWDYGNCPACGARRKSAEVSGRTTDHKCDARCLASTSGVCECACGGKNHGAAHL